MLHVFERPEGPALGLVFDSVVPGESAGQVLRPREVST